MVGIILCTQTACVRDIEMSAPNRFYFRVTGMESGVTYSFNILNLRKRDSLYNHGWALHA